MVRRGVMLAMLVCAMLVQALADGISTNDQRAFTSIIASQIDAFRAGDHHRAWSFAAPSIQYKLGNPINFMNMVRRSYAPVFSPRSYRFGEARLLDGVQVQEVELVARDGALWTAFYTFQRQPDGSWRISGCSLVRKPGAAI